MNINTPVIHTKNISGDNSQFTENTVPTIKSHQLNLDGQEVTIRAGSVFPANIAKVHGEIMLWEVQLLLRSMLEKVYKNNKKEMC